MASLLQVLPSCQDIPYLSTPAHPSHPAHQTVPAEWDTEEEEEKSEDGFTRDPLGSAALLDTACTDISISMYHHSMSRNRTNSTLVADLLGNIRSRSLYPHPGIDLSFTVTADMPSSQLQPGAASSCAQGEGCACGTAVMALRPSTAEDSHESGDADIHALGLHDPAQLAATVSGGGGGKGVQGSSQLLRSKPQRSISALATFGQKLRRVKNR